MNDHFLAFFVYINNHLTTAKHLSNIPLITLSFASFVSISTTSASSNSSFLLKNTDVKSHSPNIIFNNFFLLYSVISFKH
jgi:hypothetical protein